MVKRHLVSIDDLNKSEILHLLERAKFFFQNPNSEILKGLTCFNVFFEDSTRTVSSFFSAFSHLGGSVLNINSKSSSASKGETDFDTIINLSRLNPKFVAIRHSENTFPHLCSKLKNLGENSIIINAGDGINEHPTQALGDLFLIFEYLNKTGKKIEDLKIVLFGDLKRSRVAHSHIKIFNLFGLNKNIHLVSPIELSVDYRCLFDGLNYHLSLDKSVLEGADIIMGFRFKNEYQEKEIIVSQADLKNFYNLNHENLSMAKDDVIALHPGPVNRDVEISSKLMDDMKYSKIFDQVEYGLAMRKAIIEYLYTINK